jgi:catechol 2,3-dioxygenase-like lactoylglutathione lyase family enzyme
MRTRGVHHVGHYTRDFDATLDFYVGVLGFEVRRADTVTIYEGGQIRHVFLDMGGSEMIAFMAPENVEGVELPPEEGMTVTHHIAFEVDDPDALVDLRDHLMDEGVKVSDLVVHDWCQSIYFDDPVNRIRLEACTTTRELNEDDATMQERFSVHAEQVQEPADARSSYHGQSKVGA